MSLPILSPDPNDGFLDSVRELARLSRLHEDVAYAIGKFIESGKDFCSCDCDFEAAKATGRGLVSYKLHDDLMSLLTTFGARDGVLEDT